jgi:transcription initiation factor IIE alpha subunit
VSQQLKETLKLLSKHNPSYAALLTETIAEIEDLEKIRCGSPAARISKAINKGFTQDREIARVTDLELNLVRHILKIAQDANLVTTIDQGGKTDGARGARKQIYQRVPHG